MMLSSTIRVDVSRIVWVPVTIKSPPIVTSDPLSLIRLFASWELPLSHLTSVFPVRFALFLSEKSPDERRIPPDAVRAAPVSELTELISIVVTPPAELSVRVVAPEAVSLKFPDARDVEFAASCVIVSLS